MQYQLWYLHFGPFISFVSNQTIQFVEVVMLDFFEVYLCFLWKIPSACFILRLCRLFVFRQKLGKIPKIQQDVIGLESKMTNLRQRDRVMRDVTDTKQKTRSVVYSRSAYEIM